MALRALEKSQRGIRFARTILLTHGIPADVRVPSNVDVIPTNPITSHKAYSQIVLKQLYPHVATSHVLVIQWDGYVVNPDLWDDDFLSCDYVGAPWSDGSVGNGGFSLRSRRLLLALQDPGFTDVAEAEDVAICGHYRARLISEFKIVFAEVALARRFSFEMEVAPIFAGARTFGFHGVFNLPLVMSPEELRVLVSQFSDAIVNSEMTGRLLNNLLTVKRYEGAIALGARMLEANPGNAHAAHAIVSARRSMKTPA
jgi:hypothetical protein